MNGREMFADSVVKKAVEDEFRWDPAMDTTDIGVVVKNGVVTLTGFVRTFLQRWQAEDDAKRVDGVRGVANDIEVRLPIVDRVPDPQIARRAVQAIRYRLPYSADGIRVLVRDGAVTLEGEVEWHYQRERAERAVRKVRGVTAVFNAIELKPKPPLGDVKRSIEEALEHNPELDASKIAVGTDGNEVTLKGTVRSLAERREAERTAWSSPGITRINNQIEVNF